MTLEDKSLLIKDLCSRLPYGVKILVHSWDEREMEYVDRVDVLYSVNGDEYIKSTNEDYDFSLEDIKPYLFPLDKISGDMWSEYLATCVGGNASFPTLKSFEWCDKNHVDYRGLTPKDLALDATGLNIY